MGGVDGALVAHLEAELARERERRRSLEAQLGNLADHDPLTDLLNRRSIEHELDEHLTCCARYGSEGALLLVELEGLDEADGPSESTSSTRRVESDEAIVAVAEALIGRLRSTDLVGRWSPAELVVLLPRAGAAGAAVVAEALVDLVGVTGTARRPPGSVTASIGVAPVAGASTDAGALVATARWAVAAARHHEGGGWAMVED